ncbi:MAG: hypothetical protein H0T46_02965 [Deltaproteobacteria bacterium]|nr:hypothetical protein [Deltaproteobacteria bacterium]
MSRFVIASVLAAALSSSAFANVERFAAPPSDVAAEASVSRARPALPDRPVVLDRATVRAKLAAARAANIKRFRAYQQKGVFPSNTYDGRKLNVWMDEQGQFCAAATIMIASGKSDLVNQVAAQDNFIRLGTVKQGAVMDWILTSGLTQDEIAAIQEPFMGVMREEPFVDPNLRMAEDARLRKKYKQVDAMIAKNHQKSIDLATDRLMKNQALAWALVNG